MPVLKFHFSNMYPGLEDGSEGKVLAVKSLGPELASPEPT